MKLFLWAAFPLLLYSFRLGKVAGEPSPAALPTLSPDVVKDEEGASAFPEEAPHQKKEQDFSWISVYTPVKSCHTSLSEKHGEFSPPSFPNSFEGNIWCNWTIWAGSQQHIIIYIKGFRSGESCDVSGDKIFFHGVSSLAESTVIYACWWKEVHVFATYARGVHVVLLLRHSAHLRKERLVGKYYIFKHLETKTSSQGAVGSSEILIPELSSSVLTSLPQSEKEAFLSMWDRVNTSLSASHRTEQTGLSRLSPARREDARAADIPSFIWQVTSAEHLVPTSPGLLSLSSMDNGRSSCGPEPLLEMTGHSRWGRPSESPALPDVLSYVPYLSSSPPINPSSPTEGPALPSTSLGAFMMNDTQMGRKLTQLDYPALPMYSLPLSHRLEAKMEVNSGIVCSHSVEEVIPTTFRQGVPLPDGASRDAPGFETASLPRPERNCIRTEMQDDHFLLPYKAPERGWPSRQSGSPGLIFSSHYTSEWEIRSPSIPEESTMPLDTKSILESSVEAINLLETSWDITAPCGSPCGRLPLKAGSSYHEVFSAIENVLPVATEFITRADASLNRATEMPGGSRKINWEGQSSYFSDSKTKPESPFFLDEATTTPVVSTEPEFSISSQGHDPSFNMKPTLPFPSIELEPSLPHGSESVLLFAISEPEPAPSAMDSALSPSVVLTYPFPFIDRMLSLPEPNSLVRSETAQTLSLAVEGPGPVPSQLERASSETAAILQTATELEHILSPRVMLLELAASPTAMLNSLANEQTMSTFPPVNEMASSLELLRANAANAANALSSCCPPAASASEQEALSLLAGQPSGSVGPMVGVPIHRVSTTLAPAESAHPFPPTTMVFTKQWLSEGKSHDYFVIAPEEEAEGALCSDTVEDLDLLSETEQFPSLGGFTASRQSPRDESVTETPLVFVPVAGEEKRVMNYAFISSTALTSVLSHIEMQTRAAFPGPLKARDDATGPTVRPQECCEMQPRAERQKTALETTAADLNVPGSATLVKAPPQKNTAGPQTPRPPSNAEDKVVSHVLWNEGELGFPWLMVYLPVKSCHITLMDEAGTFSPPPLSSIQTNNWCNWTIWAGPNKHILIYIEGFEGKPDCEENQDKILFQGVMSSVENKIAYACRNHGTLTFATQAVAAHVVFLSKASSQNHGPKYFKGRYYIFEDYEMSTSADGAVVLEEPVLKSNSGIGFPSYVIHSRWISDLEKMGRIPSDENSQPMSSKGRWNKASNASSFDASLGPAVSNYTLGSFSKDMKELQVMKLSAEEYRTGNDTLARSIKKTVVLGSNGLENKEKTILLSASPYESQKSKTRTKLVAAGITTVSAGLENNGRAPVYWSPKYVKEASRAKFERSGFPSGVTFPQVSSKERRPPISLAQRIAEEDRDRVLQPWQSHAEISKKASDVVEFRHVEMKEAAGGERTDGQGIREGNGDRYAAVAGGTGRSKSHGAELLSLDMPDMSTVKPKPQLTTLAHPSVFHVISSLNVPSSDLLGIATTSHPQVVLPDSVFVFRSNENYSVLESQHNPGEVLLEVTFGIEHKGWIPQNGSELEEDLIKSVKMQVQERVKFLSNQVKEIKLKEIKRKGRSERKRTNDPDLIFTFWLHLVPGEKNISHFIHSQLEGLGGASTGSGKIRQVSVGDVNECSSGIELCGDKAVCLNGYGTYFCQCKEEYEDQSLTKSGTLCVRIPPSGLRFLYSYMEIFIGTMILFIAIIIVVMSILCTILKKRHKKKDFCSPEVALSKTPAASHSQPVTFDQNNIGNLLTLDPTCLKLRARSPEWPLQLESSPPEVCRVSIEQSECL